MSAQPAHTFGADDVPDDAFVDPETLTPTGVAPAGRSDLDLLAAELAEELDLPELTIDIPGRQGWALVVDVNIDSNALASWQRRSRDSGWPDGLNQLKLAGIVIANQTTDLVRQGERTGFSFRDKRLHGAVNAVDARSAVLKVFGGRDAAVIQTAERILSAAGHIGDDASTTLSDDDERPPSPTRRRSRG